MKKLGNSSKLIKIKTELNSIIVTAIIKIKTNNENKETQKDLLTIKKISKSKKKIEKIRKIKNS